MKFQSNLAALSIAVALLSFFIQSCKKNNGTIPSREYVYLESNNPSDNQNSIIAYFHEGNGELKPVSGSPIPTGGSGIGNAPQTLGPDDSDSQLIITADKKFLIAVNSGSNTIAVFKMQSDGSLHQVPGSPFPSGGQTPVSLSMSGQYLFVANKSMDELHTITQAPNYTTMSINADGVLTPIAGDKFETAAGTSPSQVLVSNDNKFVFGADFLGFMKAPPLGTLRSFTIGVNGSISPVTNSPYIIPAKGGALGLWQHPKSNTLYVGFPLAGQVGIYNIENNGALTYSSSLTTGPGVCWIRTTADGSVLYTLNSAENTVSAYNATAPSNPVSIQKLALKQPGPIFTTAGTPATTSQDFSIALSQDERFIFVISQHTNPDFSIGNFNYLHVLTRSVDGKMAETGEPLQIPVANNIRPQGLAVYQP